MPATPKRIGVALSGGGYRAAAFHLGTLNKLNELQILRQVNVLSTISGGSITGAAWCLYEGDYPGFHEQMKNDLRTRGVIHKIIFSWTFLIAVLIIAGLLGLAIWLTFQRSPLPMYSYLVLTALIFILLQFQFKIFPVSKVIERAYDSIFYHGKTLKDLKAKHILAIGSSNLHTGRPFTFSQKKMSDSTYSSKTNYNPPIEFLHEQFPIARAVMASSCVPFAFTPITIDKRFFKNPADYKRIRPVLVDGGVYDNQGIQKITQPNSSYECDYIITSDAGGNFIGEKKYPNAIALLIRTVDLFMYRIKTSQMVQNIYRNVNGAAKPIAYFSLGWKLDNCIPGFINNMIAKQVLKEVIDMHQLDPVWIADPAAYWDKIENHLKARVDYATIKSRDIDDQQWEIARSTGTNLSRLSENQITHLVRHAENLTEVQVKLYCPMLIN